MQSLLSVLLVATLPMPAPTDPGLYWRTCGPEQDAQCATLTVPVDWADPDGPTFGLEVARRPALDQDRRIGTLAAVGVLLVITSLYGIYRAIA